MGRGRRAQGRSAGPPVTLADGDGRIRKLPKGLVFEEQFDLFDLRALNRLAGTFKDGHTSEDVSAIAQQLSPALGRQETLCVVWAYTGQWGPAGDSETFLRDGDELLHLPSELAELLYEGRQLERDDLFAIYHYLDSRPLALLNEGLIDVDRANLARDEGEPTF